MTSTKRPFQNDASPSGRDRRERAKDAGSVRSSATDATEDKGSLRPVRTRRPGLHSETVSEQQDFHPQEWTNARELLRSVSVAFLALVDRGRPYVVPMNFAYVPGDGPTSSAGDPPGRLVFHTGPGRKTAALEVDPRVCVALSADGSFVQGASPCEDGFSFRSVLVEGQATLLEDPGQRDQALRAIVAKHDPEGADKPFDEAVLARTLVYAVEIEAVSYRELP